MKPFETIPTVHLHARLHTAALVLAQIVIGIGSALLLRAELGTNAMLGIFGAVFASNLVHHIKRCEQVAKEDDCRAIGMHQWLERKAERMRQ